LNDAADGYQYDVCDDFVGDNNSIFFDTAVF
jgi:hypothetical protein